MVLLVGFQSTLSVRRATCSYFTTLTMLIFQSTLSVRRATRLLVSSRIQFLISIHALREESDNGLCFKLNPHRISIHALREESDGYSRRFTIYLVIFQSTLSVRRATILMFYFRIWLRDFNPRSPWGERPINHAGRLPPIGFQSTLSVRRATVWAFCM